MYQIKEKTYLYIPVEIKVRELHGKLLLAMFAAEAGLKVIFGRQKELRKRLSSLPPGIYLDKSVAVSKERWFERFRNLGNTVLAWDEEGLVIQEEQYVKSRFSKKSFQQVDLFFSWGQAQRDILTREVTEDKHKILLAGNPRFDMLRPELRQFYALAAKDTHGYQKQHHQPSIEDVWIFMGKVGRSRTKHLAKFD